MTRSTKLVSLAVMHDLHNLIALKQSIALHRHGGARSGGLLLSRLHLNDNRRTTTRSGVHARACSRSCIGYGATERFACRIAAAQVKGPAGAALQ